MNKQEVIDKNWLDAIGEDYYVGLDIDENGFHHVKVVGHGITKGSGYESVGLTFSDVEYKKTEQPGNYSWRPKSLQGIENNNGWIKIEEDGSNLPINDNSQYFTGALFDDGSFDETLDISFHYDVDAMFYDKLITHYRLYHKRQPPHY